MVRSYTRRANILRSFGRLGSFLGSITELVKRLMDNIFGIAEISDSLNHVHEIRSIGEILHGIALLNSFHKSNMQKPSSSSAILLRRFYLRAVASLCLGSMVARKN
jgi:hypothetical protein